MIAKSLDKDKIRRLLNLGLRLGRWIIVIPADEADPLLAEVARAHDDEDVVFTDLTGRVPGDRYGAVRLVCGDELFFPYSRLREHLGRRGTEPLEGRPVLNACRDGQGEAVTRWLEKVITPTSQGGAK
jgi:hypothetical protein